MAGFEVIVRPVVFPNIRPAPARALAPDDNPDQGFAVLSGSGGKVLDLPHSWSFSLSHNQPQQETVRQYDKERIYKVTDSSSAGKGADGNVDKSTYIDVERLKRVRLDGGEAGPIKVIYADPPQVDNVETLESDMVRNAGE